MTPSYGLSFGIILDLLVDLLGIPGAFVFFYRAISCFNVCIFAYMSNMSLQKFCNKASATMRIGMATVTSSGKFSREIFCVRD